MNTKKCISVLTLAALAAAVCHFSSCDPSKKTAGGGTGGSVRDTATVVPVKPKP